MEKNIVHRKYTKKEIEKIAHGDPNQIGDIFSRHFYNKLSIPIVYLLLKIGITPNQVTYLALILAII